MQIKKGKVDNCLDNRPTYSNELECFKRTIMLCLFMRTLLSWVNLIIITQLMIFFLIAQSHNYIENLFQLRQIQSLTLQLRDCIKP